LEDLCIHGLKPTCSCSTIFLMCCWIWSAVSYWIVFHICLSKVLFYSLCLCVCVYLVWVSQQYWLQSLSISQNILRKIIVISSEVYWNASRNAQVSEHFIEGKLFMTVTISLLVIGLLKILHPLGSTSIGHMCLKIWSFLVDFLIYWNISFQNNP
jgi:hypothetical protein